MVLIIDIGNTTIKLALMRQGNTEKLQRTNNNDFDKALHQLLQEYPEVTNGVVCQVGAIRSDHEQLLEQSLDIFWIHKNITLPFKNKYLSSTLGNDRIALVAGAMNKSDRSKLIIDVGTCITYDYINKSNEYLGGAISPGIRLRYESLHNFTAKLPLLSPERPESTIGNTTEQSIHNGVIVGTAHEVDGFINQYLEKDQNVDVFITGGDAELLLSSLKNRFFAAPYLMLEGIYNLYIYNTI